jgi:hypothetical protein
VSPSNRIGWVTLLFLAGLAFGLAIAAHCKAAPAANFVDRLIAAQPALQSRAEPSVDPRELAEAIASIPRVNGTWAALVLTIAAHESALRARIARGECKPHECDGGRAWGLYQGHKNEANAAEWGSPDIRVQTLAAARLLRGVFYLCEGHGALSPDWAARTLSAYAGKRCEAKWPGLAERVATFERLRGRL